jgi:hypothetical protein
MPRTAIDPAAPDGTTIDVEIERLRDLNVDALRARWHTVFRRKAPPHLPRHLLFRTLAYRIQANAVGDLDPASRQLLERSGPSTPLVQLSADLQRIQPGLRPGTTLTREWDGHLQRVTVLPDGFSWNGKTYPSLSKIASAITGTRWNGPRFFGLRDKSTVGARA